MSTFSRLANRSKRQMIISVPPFRRLTQARRNRLLRRYLPALPLLSPEDADLVNRLKEDALVLTTLNDIGGPDTHRVRVALESLAAGLAAVPTTHGTVRASAHDILNYPELWRFGLDPRVLDIVENYLGMPARYHGPDVRREVADGEAGGVRQWHRDIEDQSTLKLLIWLNDVDDEGGPFGYLPVARSREVVDRLHYVAGFVSDERLRRVVPETEWRTCPGPQWTAVLADNCRLMHRATPPRVHDRYSVTFTWTTRHPIKTMPKSALTDDQVARMTAGLTPRQLACLPNDVTMRAERWLHSGTATPVMSPPWAVRWLLTSSGKASR